MRKSARPARVATASGFSSAVSFGYAAQYDFRRRRIAVRGQPTQGNAAECGIRQQFLSIGLQRKSGTRCSTMASECRRSRRR